MTGVLCFGLGFVVVFILCFWFLFCFVLVFVESFFFFFWFWFWFVLFSIIQDGLGVCFLLLLPFTYYVCFSWPALRRRLKDQVKCLWAHSVHV